MDVHASMISTFLIVGVLNLLGFEEYTRWHCLATCFCMVDYDWFYNWVATKHAENEDVLLWRWIYNAMNTTICILAMFVWWCLYNWYLFLTLNHRPNTPSVWVWYKLPVPIRTMYNTGVSITTILCGLGVLLFLAKGIELLTTTRNYCRAHYSHETTASEMRKRRDMEKILESAKASEVAETREQHGEDAARKMIIERATEELDAFKADQAHKKEKRAGETKQANEDMNALIPSPQQVGRTVVRGASGLGKMAGLMLTGHPLASAAGAALANAPSGPAKRKGLDTEKACPGKTVKGTRIECPYKGVIASGKMCDLCRKPPKKSKSS